MDQITESKIIGIATRRVDGPLKVTGSAMYASDHHFPGLVYAWPVCATIANGTVAQMDTVSAEKMPGVMPSIWGNIGRSTECLQLQDSRSS
jgi:xanthine dehydrogenase YagR molybdenum-binding subunit